MYGRLFTLSEEQTEIRTNTDSKENKKIDFTV